MELDRGALREAMQNRVTLHTPAEGAFVFPAVPGEIDDFVDQVVGAFASTRRPIGDGDRSTFRAAFLERLREGFSASPHASVRVTYGTDAEHREIIHWNVSTILPPDAAPHAGPRDGGMHSFAGSVPDARLLQLAKELGTPREATFLDVGAGPGRNALALARLGHPTDAIETFPAAADALRALARRERLDIRVTRGDFWDPALALPRSRYRLVRFSEIGPRMRGVTPVRGLFRRLAEVLEPSGAALLHVFVAREGYFPDPVTREFAETVSSPMYTREELEDAAFGLPLELASDEGVLAYEREHRSARPPTPELAAWVSGQHVFELPESTPPVELRWLVYRRSITPA